MLAFVTALLPFFAAVVACDVVADATALGSVIVFYFLRTEYMYIEIDEMKRGEKKRLYACVCARENDVDRMNENSGGGVRWSMSLLLFFFSFLSLI